MRQKGGSRQDPLRLEDQRLDIQQPVERPFAIAPRQGIRCLVDRNSGFSKPPLHRVD